MLCGTMTYAQDFLKVKSSLVHGLSKMSVAMGVHTGGAGWPLTEAYHARSEHTDSQCCTILPIVVLYIPVLR